MSRLRQMTGSEARSNPSVGGLISNLNIDRSRIQSNKCN